MALSDVKVCQRACIRAGMPPITSLTDGSAQADALALAYDDIVNDEISSYFWRFAMKQVQLNRSATAPDGRWDAAYQLPADAESVKAVTINDKPIEYDTYSNFIYCNATIDDVVIMDYLYVPPEDKWRAYFVTYIVLLLAEMLARSVAEDEQKATKLSGKADKKLIVARHMDSINQTTRKFDPTRILAARRGRRRS